jgi:soluble lytic murein transglycosylase-like protein
LLVFVAFSAGSAFGQSDRTISTKTDAGLVSSELTGPAEMVKLAIRYEHAEGVPRDYSKAHELYCAAAKMGHANAQYALGWMYANGRGVARDDNLAAYLFGLAAEQGHEHARSMTRFAVGASAPALPSCLIPAPPVIEATNTVVEEPETVFPKGRIFNMVGKVSPLYEVDPRLVLAIISVESGFNERAVSPKNAQGLMQLIPDTARRFRVKNVFDAEENIKGGVAYLQWLLAFFKGDVPLVAAAYNAGERAVERYRGVPPYPETRDYVRKVTALYKKATHPYQSHVTQPSAVLMLTATHRK